MKFPSLAASEVVKMTNSDAASDENFFKMVFSFQCHWSSRGPNVNNLLGLVRVMARHRKGNKWLHYSTEPISVKMSSVKQQLWRPKATIDYN